MARKKTSKLRVNIKASLSRRLKEVRQDRFGEHGGPELARRLNLPARTWYNYENGVTVPAEVLLGFIDETGTNPVWLLSGEGSMYRRGGDDSGLSELTPVELIRRGLEKLEQAPNDSAVAVPGISPGEAQSDFVAVNLVPLRALTARGGDIPRPEGHILAYRHWLPHPGDTLGVRLEDDAMEPVLPSGSVVAIDRAITDPKELQGRMVAVCPSGMPMIRWLDLSARHMILRPNQPSREHPLIPIELDELPAGVIIGQVVWSWSRFSGA